MSVARFDGVALRTARDHAHLTRGQVAAALAVASPDRVRIWEEGIEQPQPATIPRLAELLDVSPLLLLTGVGEPPCLSALRLAAGLSRTDVVAAATTLTHMTYVRLDSGRGPRRPPQEAVLSELAAILGVSRAAAADAISQARTQATTGDTSAP